MLEIVFAFFGFLVGLNTRQSKLIAKYDKTFQQVDADIRRDLEYYRNLCESLKQDLHEAKQKVDSNKKI